MFKATKTGVYVIAGGTAELRVRFLSADEKTAENSMYAGGRLHKIFLVRDDAFKKGNISELQS